MPAESPSRSWSRTILRLLMTPDWPGAPIARIAGPSSFLNSQRQDVLEHRYAARCAAYFSRLTVEAGPFAGMHYPAGAAHGSVLHPKLLGTYESELHPALARMRGQTYDDIVDVGFAEGYYLTGLAKWFPHAAVWGFDLSEEAHRLCIALASANGIQTDRLRLAGEATESALAPALSRRALVICDCEGCESALFSVHRMDRWKRADLIIECHDFIEPGVTAAISGRLAATHHVELVTSIAPELKIVGLPSSLRARFSPAELVRLVGEGRPFPQTWIVATAKSS